MATKIEWTDETWNPVTGCTKVSTGCKHCYAERLWPRLSAPGQPYQGRKFTDVQCHPKRLMQPLLWMKPKRIFVNSISDLFHEDVPYEFLWDVFEVMCKASHHTFQILTKRPERMWEWVNRSDFLVDNTPQNIWLGVSVEDQATADERIPILLDTPAAKRFLSIEPMLGPVDIHNYLPDEWSGCARFDTPFGDTPPIDWVVVGGESGHKARPMHPDWVRTVRDQCKESDTPFFFKQWGEWQHVPTVEDSRVLPSSRLKYFPDIDATFFRAGKRASGRELDGHTHEGYPA